MADFPSLPLWTDAWVADTHHLTRLQRGTYHDLLVLMWRTPRCRVPNDDDWLASHMHMTKAEVETDLRPLIREFCKNDGNYLTQKRLSREWRWCHAKAQTASESAKLRWEKEKEKKKRISVRISERNAPTPTPTPIKEKESVSPPLSQTAKPVPGLPPPRPPAEPKPPARGYRAKPDPARQSDFNAWWKACARTIPKPSSRVVAQRVFCSLPDLPPVAELIAAWDAYNTDLAERNKGQRYKQAPLYAESFLKRRVFDSYLADIRRQNADAHQRKAELDKTILHWNGYAPTFLSRVSLERFSAMFIGTSLTVADNATILHTTTEFQARRIEDDQAVNRVLHEIFTNLTITSPERKASHA